LDTFGNQNAKKLKVTYFFSAEEEEFNEDLDSPVPAPASKSEPEQSVAEKIETRFD